MIPEGFQIDPEELAAIVPDCYAEFRPIVADGLTFFLQHLSPPRLAEIFQAQADLPADAGLAQARVLPARLPGVAQTRAGDRAADRHLDPELRRHLQELESLEPHTPAEQWRPALARALAPVAEEYRSCIDDCAGRGERGGRGAADLVRRRENCPPARGG